MPSRLLFAGLAAAAAFAISLRCHAQPRSPSARGPVAVLGLLATPGEDEAATNMTVALEHAAQRMGFTVAQRMPSLEQALAIAGCDERSLRECIPRIAEDLQVLRVIYGRAIRSGANVRFETSLYDAPGRAHRNADPIDVARALAVDSDALVSAARRAIDALIPPGTPPAQERSSAPPQAVGAETLPLVPPYTAPVRPRRRARRPARRS